jgi:hypothetical protein
MALEGLHSRFGLALQGKLSDAGDARMSARELAPRGLAAERGGRVSRAAAASHTSSSSMLGVGE